MSKKPEIVKVKILSDGLARALSVKAGATVPVECRGGVPLTAFWRNRFKDARIDNAIEVLNNTPSRSKKVATADAEAQ